MKNYAVTFGNGSGMIKAELIEADKCRATCII